MDMGNVLLVGNSIRIEVIGCMRKILVGGVETLWGWGEDARRS